MQPGPRRVLPWAPDVGLFGIALVLILTWLVAVPRWAVPDEPSHVFKAYGTAHGQLLGHAVVTDPPTPSNVRRFDGPASLGVGDVACYFRQPDVPAGCELGVDPRLLSSAARYPPYYYAVVGGVAAAVGHAESVRAYRLASAVICAGAVALALALVRRSRARRHAPLVLVALTPMALFMLASVNPNATEIAGFLVVWALLVRMATDDVLSPKLTLAAGIATGALVMSRPISAAWMVCVAAVVLLVTPATRRREFFRRRYLARFLVPLALSAAASIAWLRYSSFEVGDQTVARGSARDSLRESIDRWPEYYRQTIGVLGWLDTRLPTVTYAGWTVALILVAAIHLRRATAAQRSALVALVAAWLALPVAINAFTAADAGLSFQGRYSLPILAGVAFLPMFGGQRPFTPPRREPLMWCALASITVAEVAGFWQMLRRFSVGASGRIWLVGDLPWRPTLAPMFLIVLNAVAMTALCGAAVAWRATTPGSTASPARRGHGNGHGPQAQPVM